MKRKKTKAKKLSLGKETLEQASGGYGTFYKTYTCPASGGCETVTGGVYTNCACPATANGCAGG
jgi:hypothetical protein